MIFNVLSTNKLISVSSPVYHCNGSVVEEVVTRDPRAGSWEDVPVRPPPTSSSSDEMSQLGAEVSGLDRGQN